MVKEVEVFAEVATRVSELRTECCAIFFAIELSSRRIEIAGVARAPEGPWMMQAARNLLDPVGGFLLGKRYPEANPSQSGLR